MEPELKFYDRCKSDFETEKVYGDKWLRFIYHNPVGRLSLWLLVKRKIFSKWYGWRMNRHSSAKKIIPFINNFKLDETEFLDKVSSFKSFNEFFYRKLKPESRPINRESGSVVFPADGRHLAIENISSSSQVYAKGQFFNLEKLLNSADLSKKYANGDLIISRLCPTDYHRFHFPVSGKLSEIQLIDGYLKSVNPIALRKNLGIFWENKRYLTKIENPDLGEVIVVLIGATCVGSVHISAEIHKHYSIGDELGYFSFGGSCLITLFQPDKIKIDKELAKITNDGYEIYAKFGDRMAKSLIC